MARIIRCRFCGQNATNHDHDSCAQEFREKLGQELLDHAIKSPTKTLPQRIRKKMRGPLWQAYNDYLRRCKERSELERKCAECGASIQEELQTIASKIIRDLYPSFHIAVSVQCTPIPTF